MEIKSEFLKTFIQNIDQQLHDKEECEIALINEVKDLELKLQKSQSHTWQVAERNAKFNVLRMLIEDAFIEKDWDKIERALQNFKDNTNNDSNRIL